VHFFCLDGGAHPEVCLAEFEHALAYLAPDGVIMVDDANQIPPLRAYRLPRPFGKATLILPMLLLASYLEIRHKVSKANSVAGDPRSIPDSHFLNQLERTDTPNVSFTNFAVAGSGHQILLYGSPAFIRENTAQTNSASVLASLDDRLLERSSITLTYTARLVSNKIKRFFAN